MAKSEINTDHVSTWRKPTVPWELELAETTLWIESRRPNRQRYLDLLIETRDKVKKKYEEVLANTKDRSEAIAKMNDLYRLNNMPFRRKSLTKI